MQSFPSQLDALMKLEGYKPKYRVSYLMGIYIPASCIVFLLVCGILVSLCVLK